MCVDGCVGMCVDVWMCIPLSLLYFDKIARSQILYRIFNRGSRDSPLQIEMCDLQKIMYRDRDLS